MAGNVLNIFTRGSSTYTIVGLHRKISAVEADGIIAKWRREVMEAEYAAWLRIPGNEDWNGNAEQMKEELFIQHWQSEGAYLIVNEEKLSEVDFS